MKDEEWFVVEKTWDGRKIVLEMYISTLERAIVRMYWHRDIASGDYGSRIVVVRER